MSTENRLSLRKAAIALGTMAVLGSAVVTANPAVASDNPCHPAALTTADISGNPCGATIPDAATNPCAATDPCAAANPCAATNPYAARNPCAARWGR